MKILPLFLLGFVAVSVSAFSPIILESRADRLVSREWSETSGGLWKRTSSNNRPPNETYDITIFHINDVHAHLDEYRSSGTDCTNPTQGCFGGYARVKQKLEELRPGAKNSLLLNIGDEFQGTLFFTFYGGEKIAETINQMGFDAFVPGNHEWDRGDDYLATFLNNLTFPAVCANVQTNNTALDKAMAPYHIFEKQQLAVIGVTTQTTSFISSPGKGTQFLDPIKAVQDTADHIRGNTDVKRIVAMTHIGYDLDKEMAQKTRGIHLIVGGHSHTLLGNMTGALGPYPTIEKNLDGEEVFVVTSYRWGEYLGYLDVSFDHTGKIVAYTGAPIHLDNSTKQDAELEATIKDWRKPFEAYAAQVVAETVNDLDQTICQSGECTLGDLVADATLAYRLNISANSADACLVNAGGIRTTIPAGPVTIGQVLTVLPFGNLVADVTFPGSDLWKIFEGIGSRVNQWNNQQVTSFVQVSSEFRVVYNANNPIGSKLVSLSLKNETITPETTKEYKIVTWDFVANGGDNFWPAKTGFNTLDSQEQAVLQYLQEKKTVDVKLDGRIMIQ
ncbi:Metallo-dependent phosphatase [Marasmius fiardii PR-910]|nr:Metallo-dependent phosphatase [Marasmius fiardii PR-910]